MKIKAMIFAAGLGTRMRPLTDHVPKALIPVNGQPLIWYAIQQLLPLGISSLVVNIHHRGEQMIDYFETTSFGFPVIISDERTLLLDTGGGLFKARASLNDADIVVAMNADIISNAQLQPIISQHLKNKAMATLVVRQRETMRYLLFDHAMQLSGWKNLQTGENKIAGPAFENSKPYAFSGIQVIDPRIFETIDDIGKFSMIDVYLRLAKTQKIMGYVDDSGIWIDVGKPGALEQAESLLNRQALNG
ncbi:MAG: nucleotidyltransferase family protein [Prolixibacteraceae bacterium]|nr:nucleotidyltransferase family protein [Prolixibacteraceae bacterium]